MFKALAFLVVVGLAVGCGGTEADPAPSASTTPAASAGAQFSQFDVLSGTFTTASGFSAAISDAALVETTAGGDGVLAAQSSFTDADPIRLVFSNPADGNGQLTLTAQLAGATAGPLELSCTEPGQGQSLFLSLAFVTGKTNLTYVAGSGGHNGSLGSCTLTITSATPAGVNWGLHGSLTATVVNYENTTETGTFSATF